MPMDAATTPDLFEAENQALLVARSVCQRHEGLEEAPAGRRWAICWSPTSGCCGRRVAWCAAATGRNWT